MSRECPEPPKKKGGPRTCHKCNQEGHMSRECPTGGGDSSRPKGCFNCGGEGHMSKDCTEERKPRAGGGGGGGGGKCYKCQQEGHMSRECPENGGDGTKSNACHKCNEEGHIAKDCTKEVLGPDGKPRPPLYKPADISEDTEGLFDNITSGINFSKYNNIVVNVTGTDVPKQITSFDDVIESETLKSAIAKANYKVPTPVQKYAMPIILAGRDLMSCAQTGSGKTLAFLLPIIQSLFTKSGELADGYGQEAQKPSCVVITPTRELAIQIHAEAYKCTLNSIIKPALIYGGTSAGFQMSNLSRGCHVLVATPGRLVDFVNRGKISFENLKYLVLDEADRMIDQGFLPEIRKLMTLANMPAKGAKQMLMFSATFPEEIQRLAAEFLADNYIFLAVGVVGAANTDVEQNLEKVGKFEKRKALEKLLGSTDIKDRTMIFVEQKTTADFLASFLSQNDYKATSIHGDRYQSQREEALRDFRTGRMPLLVATSVASRGLDIKDVRHVINYDLPKEIDDYVHRIGRTGRVGNLGKATSFYDPVADKALAATLLKVLETANQVVPEWLKEESAGGVADFDGAGNFGGSDIRRVRIIIFIFHHAKQVLLFCRVSSRQSLVWP